MDCEKFEDVMLDELYGELDELTSAAAKRHLGGCARCAALFDSLSATKRMVAMPLEPAPVGLEARILAAAEHAQKVVPFRSQAARALSRAGSWAMRPQTAMAALFLLMVGSSVVLLRQRSSEQAMIAPEAVAVPGEGTPKPSSIAAEPAPLDPELAARAHGAPQEERGAHAAPTAAAQNATPQATSEGTPESQRTVAARRPKTMDSENPFGADSFGSKEGVAKREQQAFATPPPPAAAAPAQAPSFAEAPAPPADSLGAGQASQGGNVGATASNEAKTDVAKKGAAACASSLAEWERRGTTSTKGGRDAILAAADCHRQLGHEAQARALYSRLLSFPEQADSARNGLASLDQLAASRSRNNVGGRAATAAPSKPAAPAEPGAPLGRRARQVQSEETLPPKQETDSSK